MNIFCTYFDKNFLAQGISLIESMENNVNFNFLLYILCLDNYTYNILEKLNLKKVVLLKEDELLNFEPRLKIAKKNRPIIEYYYCFTANLIRYLFETKDCESVTYLDSDVYFFDSLNDLNDFNKYDIIIIRHLTDDKKENQNGKYNVCLNYFKKSSEAKKCLEWWSDKTLQSTKLSKDIWGDQKYLDEFPKLFKNIKEIIPKTICLAPWNLNDYEITLNNGKIVVNNENLIIYHFARLIIVNENLFIPIKRIYMTNKLANIIYKPYCMSLSRSIKRIKSIDKKYKIRYTRRNLKGLFLGIMLGRAFSLKKKKFKRFGISIPIGYEK